MDHRLAFGPAETASSDQLDALHADLVVAGDGRDHSVGDVCAHGASGAVIRALNVVAESHSAGT